MPFLKSILFFLLIVCFGRATAQIKPFRFAFISDTHIGSPNGAAEEDLRRAIADINTMKDIDFVVLTGDITELGKNEELKLAKKILDSLKIPYYIIPGNHDTGWSESGGVGFANTFGSDRFVFDHNGIRFIGCASGPYVRMSDGHIPRSHVLWLDSVLKRTKLPVVFLNHYPMNTEMDNWYEVIDLLYTRLTLAILCGHGHANKAMDFENIPGVMGRSNLRAKAKVGGFNIVSVTNDSMVFFEKKHLDTSLVRWTKVPYGLHPQNTNAKRPYPEKFNQAYKNVTAKWSFASTANVISTPAITNELVVFGNQDGVVEAVSLKKGKMKWKFETGAAIFSSPAVINDKIILASADSFIYCINTSGKLQWKFKTNAAVLGSPLIHNNIIYIGGSDGNLRAIDMNGNEKWKFDQLTGPVVSTPIVYNNILIFGAWDRNLYALNISDGSLKWKWNNGSTVINFSPASCIPVAHDGIVYIAAPDRFLTALDIETGNVVWRTKEAGVRESIGISEDGQTIYGKTMNDTIVAFKTGREKQLAWRMNCGFGYEHVPSMLIEKQNDIFFGTKNGVVYSISSSGDEINWAYKIDNSMVNTVNVVDRKRIIASTMDGKVVFLHVKD